ncbi:MAG: hypothetical protein HQM15_10010 [Deltaproteobacteria bacterium]|nr:hypothetical protein [Deltaproteobacteria bacterium]
MKIKIIFLVFLFSFCCFNAGAKNDTVAENTWTKIAEPTRMAEMLHYLFVHPQGLFARSVLNRVLKYNPQEKRWENFDEGLPPNSASILFPDGDKLYAGTHSGIFVSDGKVNHWKKVGEGTQAYAPFGLAKSAGRLYAVSKEGVFSFDGKSWVILSDPLGEVSDLRAWAMDDRGILVASNQNIFFYNQKTRAWSNITENLGQNDRLKNLQDVYLENDVLYLGLIDEGVFRKKIDEKEWQGLNNGIPKGEKFKGFSQPYQSPMVYTDQDQYLLSSDGKSWKSAGYKTPPFIHSIVPYKKTLYAAGESGAFQQDKKGAWESIHAGLKTEAVSDFKTIADELYATSASGLYRFSEDKNLWVNLMGGAAQDCQQPIEYMQLLNGKTYLGSYVSGVLEAELSKNLWNPLGKNWPLQKLPAAMLTQFKPCFSEVFESVPFLGEYQNTLVAATLQQVYRLSSDQHWIKWLDSKDRILGILGVNKDFYVGTMKGLYRYQDQNKTWQKIPLGTLENTYVSHLTRDEKYLYVETQDERIFRLDLKNQKWEELSPLPDAQTIICEMKQINGKMWALGAKGVFAWNKTENKWEEVLKNPVDEKYCPAATETKDALFILKQDGLYRQEK